MTHAEKLEAAKAYLGARYVCHPTNWIKKFAHPLPDTYQLPNKVLRKKKGRK